jgi:hypothetical protein
MIEKISKKSLVLVITALFIAISFSSITGVTNRIKKETVYASKNLTFYYEKYQENSEFSISRGFEGITWDGEYLWLAKSETNKIYKLDQNDHTIIDSFSSPGGFPTGLAWDGEYLWNADWETDRIYKLNSSNGNIVNSYYSPASFPYGLTWDGEYLWHTDMGTEKLYKLRISEDPDNIFVVSYLSSPGGDPTGLTWDGKYLWNADREEDQIYALDPLKGFSVICSFETPGLGPRGLSWDGVDMWHTDLKGGLSKIDVSCDPPNTPSRPNGPDTGFPKVKYTYSTKTYDPNGDNVRYGWDWNGDYKVDNWTDYCPSGETCTISHSFTDIGTYEVRVMAQDINGGKSDWSYSLTVTISNKSNLNCSGKINWNKARPNNTISNNFTIRNDGGPDSELDWKILSYPDWGKWTFNPKSGKNLKPSDGAVTVEVILVVPNEKEKKFSGEIILLNEEDSNNICKIPVSLTTPKNKALYLQTVILKLLENQLEIFHILRYILKF